MTDYADLEKRLREDAEDLRVLEGELIERDIDMHMGPISPPSRAANNSEQAADALASLRRELEEAKDDYARRHKDAVDRWEAMQEAIRLIRALKPERACYVLENGLSRAVPPTETGRSE